MLHNLPAEAIISISKYLSLYDRLSLNATCRKINDLITKNTLYELYENLDLRRCWSKVKDIIENFETNRFKGMQVKTLMLNIDQVPSDIIPRLSHIFPNITRFSVYPDDGYRDYNPHPISEPMATWRNTIEEYSVRGDWFPIWRTLEYHTFPRLADLKIEGDVKFDDNFSGIGNVRITPSYLLPFVKNAPSLKNLFIKGCNLSLDFLEALHASCPHIEVLTLDSDIFIIINDALPESIVPANSVLELTITQVDCFDRNGLLLDYILKKYPNLKYFCFVARDNTRLAFNELGIKEPDSYSYSYYNTNDSSRIKIDEYMAFSSSHKSTIQAYRNSTSKFFSSLPKTITNLKIDSTIFEGVIEALSQSDMRPFQLNIQETLGFCTDKPNRSNQLAYLKNLPSVQFMEMKLHPSVQTLNPDFISASFTTLIIQTYGGRYNIEWLLSAFPSLVTLCVRGGSGVMIGHVDDGSKMNQPQKIYPNLRQVVLGSSQVQSSVIDYIRLAAPNVKQLDLSIGLLSESTKTKACQQLDLTGWDLDRCYLYLYHPTIATENKECKITVDNITKYYFVHPQKYMMLLPNQSYHFKWLHNVLRVDIKCDNIKDLKIYNFRIKKIDKELLVVL